MEKTTNPFPAAPMIVSNEDFEKITKIPVVVYFGDNIPTGSTPVENWGQDNWCVRLNMANEWAKVVNAHDGDVTILVLPEVGIKGNTHFMMTDTNNKEVADHMEQWMKASGTDNKELYLIPGAIHIQTYWVPEYVDQILNKLDAFYDNTLK